MKKENKLTGNKEYAICENCGKEYIKRKYTIRRKGGNRIRGMNTKTCSKKCSKERPRMVNRIKKKK